MRDERVLLRTVWVGDYVSMPANVRRYLVGGRWLARCSLLTAHCSEAAQ